MKLVFIIIATLYYFSWMMNIKRINNVVYNSVKVPLLLKYILSPLKRDNDFDLSSIIIKLYAHVSLVTILILSIIRSMDRFPIQAWLAFTFSIICVCGIIDFAYEIKKRREKMISTAINILILIISIIGFSISFYVGAFMLLH